MTLISKAFSFFLLLNEKTLRKTIYFENPRFASRMNTAKNATLHYGR